ncbi:hypothetical protein ACFY9U_32650 [Streptomyces anthocyanicus]|uniref:hypothetical protein n=1 Tax=Streptomyces violaceoruber group TaxID=2867121 RepID=UPI0031D0C2A3
MNSPDAALTCSAVVPDVPVVPVAVFVRVPFGPLPDRLGVPRGLPGPPRPADGVRRNEAAR